MVEKEDPWNVRQLVLVAAAVAAAAAIALRAVRRKGETLLRWHCGAALISLDTFYGFVRGRGTWVGYVVHPFIVVVSVCLLYPTSRVNRGVAVLYAILTVVGSLHEPLSDIAGAAYLLYLAWSVDAVSPALCAAESAAVAVLFATANTDEVTLRAEHFTWWSITSFALWDAVLFFEAYVGPRSANKEHLITNRVANVIMVVVYVVLVGVLFMSAAGCSLLTDALEEADPGLYIFGNFLMHYYPVVRIFFYRPVVRLNDMLRGVALCVLYAATYPATDVYGCAEPTPAYTAAIMAGVAFLVTGVVWFSASS